MNSSSHSQSVVIYGRLSKGDAALESHEARNLEYVLYKGFDLVERFADEDTSGKIPLTDRRGGSALIRRIEQGDIRHLVVAKLDRLGRRARDILLTLETLAKHHCTLHIVDFGGDTITTQGHLGKFILTLFAGLAEWELGEIQDRTQKRAEHKMSQGELIGTIPYGYDCRYSFADGYEVIRATVLTVAELAALKLSHGGEKPTVQKQLEPNPAEQRWLRQMVVWRTTGRCTLGWIAAQLNAAGVPSKQGGRWACGNVDGVMRSKHTERLLQTPAPLEEVA